jgi:hypothetical protein
MMSGLLCLCVRHRDAPGHSRRRGHLVSAAEILQRTNDRSIYETNHVFIGGYGQQGEFFEMK